MRFAMTERSLLVPTIARTVDFDHVSDPFRAASLGDATSGESDRDAGAEEVVAVGTTQVVATSDS